MKRLCMGFAGVMMAISLAACTPTQVTETAPNAAGHSNPEGLTPEMVKESQEVVEKRADPNAPVFEMAFVYSVNDEGNRLVRQVEDVEVLSEETLGECLAKKGVLSEGVEVLSFTVEGGGMTGPGVESQSADNTERIGIVELSQAPAADAGKEQLVLGAIANTFIENYELDKFQILVDQEVYNGAGMTDGYLTYTDDYDEKEGEFEIETDDGDEKTFEEEEILESESK
ncbi:MAG: GerMN domain-containing protein [Hungatella sp.]|jgi:hypothetical protein|nr:GerMN domain-containing protein [Hungatella sp.]